MTRFPTPSSRAFTSPAADSTLLMTIAASASRRPSRIPSSSARMLEPRPEIRMAIFGFGIRRGLMLFVDDSRCQERNHDLVMPYERKPAAASGNRSPHHIGQRAILLNEIKVSGRKILELVSKIANDRDRLQKDFRQYYR